MALRIDAAEAGHDGGSHGDLDGLQASEYQGAKRLVEFLQRQDQLEGRARPERIGTGRGARVRVAGRVETLEGMRVSGEPVVADAAQHVAGL